MRTTTAGSRQTSGGRPTRRAKRAGRLPPRLRGLTPDLLATGGLALLLGVSLAVAALRAPTRVAFGVDRPPPGVVLRNFYDLEHNAGGPFRWSKPEASLTIPVAAPGSYRVALTLQDSPAAPPGRPVTLYLDGAPAGATPLAVAPGEHAAVGRLAPRAWAEGWGHALQVELQTPAFVPPGDPRALGAVLSAVTVEPVGRPAERVANYLLLLLPNLLLLGALCAMLRLLGLGVGPTAGLLAAALAGYAALAAGAPSLALALGYEPVHRPLPFAGALAFVLATPPLARAAERWLPSRDQPAPPSGAGRASRWPAGLREALWLFLLLRCGLSLVALLAALTLSLRGPCAGAEPVPVLHASGLDYRLLGVWQRWDGCWYEKIAAHGYRPGDPSINFFPLYPLLMRAASLPLAGNLTLGGLVVSGLAYVAAMVGLYQLVGADFGAGVARRTMLALSLFPAAFFLFAPFSEALFLALAVWCLLLARRGAWGWAALPAFLLGLTRLQGALLAVPLAWEAWRCYRGATGNSPCHGDPSRPDRRRLAAALVPALPVCGLLLYLAYGSLAVGRTTLDTQGTQWGNSPRAPWTALAASWAHARREADPIEAINLALVLVALALLALGMRRLPIAYTLYAAPQVLLVVAHQNAVAPLLAASRYLLVVFPLFVVVALAGRWRRFYYPWLIVSAALLLYLLYRFLSGPLVA